MQTWTQNFSVWVDEAVNQLWKPPTDEIFGQFDVHFDEQCKIQIENSDKIVFSADMSEFIFAGYGTADRNAEHIIVDGNLDKFPKVTLESRAISCPTMRREENTLYFDGEIDVPHPKSGNQGLQKI